MLVWGKAQAPLRSESKIRNWKRKWDAEKREEAREGRDLGDGVAELFGVGGVVSTDRDDLGANLEKPTCHVWTECVHFRRRRQCQTERERERPSCFLFLVWSRIPHRKLSASNTSLNIVTYVVRSPFGVRDYLCERMTYAWTWTIELGPGHKWD